MSKLQYKDKVQGFRISVYNDLQRSLSTNSINTPVTILFTNTIRHSINLVRDRIKDLIKDNVTRSK
jgi:hypothetical protein